VCVDSSLSRTAPGGISESIEISAITHDDERAATACAAYNEIPAALVNGLPRARCAGIGLATALELGSDEVAAALAAGGALSLALICGYPLGRRGVRLRA
jgi:ADP-ribosylglycohydrolase